MLGERNLAVILALVLISRSWATSEPQSQRAIDHSKVKVQILLDKSEFAVGENISYRISFSNNSERGFYIDRNFVFLSGVKQLSGRPASIGCGVSGYDVGFREDDRKAEQILKEDFLWLERGTFIGVHKGYPECGEMTLNPGTYEISARYVSVGT